MELQSFPQWMQEEDVQTIPKEKLQLLQEIYTATQGKPTKQMMPLLLPLLKKAKERNLTFTSEEMSCAFKAIQKHSTPDEKAQLEKVLKAQNIKLS